MIYQPFVIERYNWRVCVYYAVTHYDCDAIVAELRDMGVDEVFVSKARESMESGSLNTGFTYSDMEHRKSLMVLNCTSSAGEFANSLSHESLHLVMHIAKRCALDPNGEGVCYLSGGIAQTMHPVTKNLLSECGCHERAKKRYVRRYRRARGAN